MKTVVLNSEERDILERLKKNDVVLRTKCTQFMGLFNFEGEDENNVWASDGKIVDIENVIKILRLFNIRGGEIKTSYGYEEFRENEEAWNTFLEQYKK